MTKQEVIREMGAPDGTEANESEEILVYNANIWHPVEGWAFARQFGIILVNGRVSAYGNAKTVHSQPRAPATVKASPSLSPSPTGDAMLEQLPGVPSNLTDDYVEQHMEK